jgi:Aspartyl protease
VSWKTRPPVSVDSDIKDKVVRDLYSDVEGQNLGIFVGRSEVLFRHVQTLGCFAAFCVAGSVAAAQEISMPFQLQDNLIRVPILINGSKADAVLDSGTGALGVDRTFALSLGLRPGEENGKIPGGGAGSWKAALRAGRATATKAGPSRSRAEPNKTGNEVECAP